MHATNPTVDNSCTPKARQGDITPTKAEGMGVPLSSRCRERRLLRLLHFVGKNSTVDTLTDSKIICIIEREVC
jgi:hypothetical protein